MGTARKMADALNTAGEYRKNIGQITPVAEAFAVTYPEGNEKFALYALESAWHPFQSFAPLDSLEDIAQTIKAVLTRRPPEAEHSEAMMVRLLRSAVQQIAEAFSRQATTQLVEVFGKDNPLFVSLLPMGKSRAATEMDARQAAAYLLVNQLLFYNILSVHPELDLPKADPATITPLTLHPQYFVKVLEVDYKPVFEFDIASKLDRQEGTRALRAVLYAFENSQANQISNDVIGKIFHNLIPIEKRKPLGAYYTNSNAAHLLAHLTIDREFDRVMDPACGSGTMLVSAYTVKGELYSRAGRSIDMNIHERFVAQQITGVDIMPFAAHLAVVNLALQAPEHKLQKVRVAIHDSLELKPGVFVESARSVFLRAARFGMRRIDSYGEHAVQEGGIQGDFKLDPVDVILMNPPFSDSERIPKPYKADIVKRFGPPGLAQLLRGKYSLQLPFLLLTHEFLVQGGRIGAVLPVTTFTGEAFQAWLRFVLRSYTIRAMIVGFGRTAFSENTALSECLLVAEKMPPDVSHRFVLLGAESPPPQWTNDTVHHIAEAIRAGREEQVPGLYVSRLVKQSHLDPAVAGLQTLVARLHPRMASIQNRLDDILRARGIPFSELEQKVGFRLKVDVLSNKEQPGPQGRGLEFYCAPALAYFSTAENAQNRKSDRLIIEGSDGTSLTVRDKTTGVTFMVPITHIIPLARRLSGITKIDSTETLDYIAARHFRNLDRIIEHMVETTPKLFKGTTKTTQADQVGIFVRRVRERWPKRVAQGRGRVWMVRKIDLGAPGSCVIASYSELDPMIGGNMWLLTCPEQHRWMEKALALWLNSSLFLAQLMGFRSETRGSWGRIDKHKMQPSLGPDFTQFDETQRNGLKALFDRVKDSPLPSIKEQLETEHETRWEIDLYFLRLLRPELSRAEQEQFLSDLYAALWQRLEQMLRAMTKDTKGRN